MSVKKSKSTVNANSSIVMINNRTYKYSKNDLPFLIGILEDMIPNLNRDNPVLIKDILYKEFDIICSVEDLEEYSCK